MHNQDTFYSGDFQTKEAPSPLLVVKTFSCLAQGSEKKPGSRKDSLLCLWLKNKVFLRNYIELGRNW